jgi:phosphoglycerol transferase MdoB-like AlkP superfamily enzyme
MHGNYASMWNREKVHPNLGYQAMYFRESFEIPDKDDKDYINLGISDSAFFKQVIPKLENIEENNTNYMGTIITLSNHSPYTFLDKYGEFDLSTTITNENGTKEKVDYLSDTAVGRYIKSSHYADKSLGEFIEYIENSDYFDNTVFVFYGDHDSKLSRSEVNVLYNMNYETGELYTESDPEYYDYNTYEHDLNKNTPLIIWSKNKNIRNKLHGTVSYPMGMYDVMPTLGNMLGIKNEFAIGHDIFNIKNNNIVIFPNGNFLTSTIYYVNSDEKYYVTKQGAVIDEDYVSECILYAEKRLEVSNAIIIHDLIYNEGPTLYSEEINGQKEQENE